MDSLLVYCLIYIIGKTLSLGTRNLTWVAKVENYGLSLFPFVRQFTDPGTLTVRILIPFRERTTLLLQEHTVNLPSSLLQRDLQPFTRMSLYWGKGNT